MNLSEVNWDIDSAGSWPLPVKIGAVVIICSLVIGAWVYYDTIDQIDALERIEKEEPGLKKTFEAKQKKAVNLPAYQQQLEQIEKSLDEMVRQMPTKAEVASLLIDISQAGLSSGLEFELFKPQGERKKEFYFELPIDIVVTGKYEEFGLFVSGLVSLPRIVTVHDVKITPLKDELMKMTAIVKTYNEGVEDVDPAPRKKRRKR